jgi:hypothetical protein
MSVSSKMHKKTIQHTSDDEDVQIKGTKEDAGVKITGEMAIQHTSDCRHAHTICLKIPKTTKPKQSIT